MSEIKVYCDGACEPTNPGGWATWGWIAFAPTGTPLKNGYGVAGHGGMVSNNLAEYTAVIMALRYIVTLAERLAEQEIRVNVFADSQLVINQVNDTWKCNRAHLRVLRSEVWELRDKIRAFGVPLAFTWIPREQNQEADRLSRIAYREATRNT